MGAILEAANRSAEVQHDMKLGNSHGFKEERAWRILLFASLFPNIDIAQKIREL